MFIESPQKNSLKMPISHYGSEQCVKYNIYLVVLQKCNLSMDEQRILLDIIT